ncbi:hypothetical protein DICVIV_13871 [Dictyocaulus viviparus]|uniref:NADH:ubiquinone reductase (H(+)-translocating) n=1 Tax=Dictyocaulus viviparus TaxID=29172 RepID=A0A0D8X6R6_DICVI|nr:hypothetical protein DICVIV_13871 [Dictyocaulus viviparus]
MAERIVTLYDNNIVKLGTLFIFVGLSIRMALFPLSRWLVNSYSEAPSFVSIFFLGTVTKVMIYVFIKIFYTVFHQNFFLLRPPLNKVIIILACCAIVSGSIFAMTVKDMERLLANSSVSQVQDECFTQYYKEITQALLTIFRSLVDSFPQYVQQVRVFCLCKMKLSHKYYKEITQALLTIFRSLGHSFPQYVQQDAWIEDHSVKVTVVSVLEQTGTALCKEFAPHIVGLIPYLLRVVQTDKSEERKLTTQVLSCMRSLSRCLTPHLHLVLPPVLMILDDPAVPISVRQSARVCPHIAELIPYLLRVVQTDKSEERKLTTQMWKHFEVFRRSVDSNLRKYNLNSGEAYEKYIKIAQKAMLHPAERPGRRRGTGAVPPEKITVPHTFTPSDAKNIKQILSWTVNKQRLNINAVVKAWAVDSLVSKEEWSQRLVKLRIAFIKSGSSAAIRAAASLKLTEELQDRLTGSLLIALETSNHPDVIQTILNQAEFIGHSDRGPLPIAYDRLGKSTEETKAYAKALRYMELQIHKHFDRELTEELQDRLTGSLLIALETSNHPDVIQTILNLAEFKDHSERGPLPIAYDRLGKSTEETKAYAKALRYKELQIHKHFDRGGIGLTTEDCQALITYANKLNAQEEAAGVVGYAEQHEMVIPADPEPLSDEMIGHQIMIGVWNH